MEESYRWRLLAINSKILNRNCGGLIILNQRKVKLHKLYISLRFEVKLEHATSVQLQLLPDLKIETRLAVPLLGNERTICLKIIASLFWLG
jgi:hypothetical protein